MAAAPYEPAEAPTLYFIGVTTGQSSIMPIFPHWMAYLGLDEARIVGVDFPLDTPPQAYREVVAFLKGDPQSKGALVTTHKIDPDVDETRDFLLEDLAYSESLLKFGYIGGVGPASYEQPRGNLTGDPYFTDGRRLVMWVTGEPTALDEIEVLDLSPYATGVTGD